VGRRQERDVVLEVEEVQEKLPIGLKEDCEDMFREHICLVRMCVKGISER
jgi:hypothetical protein